MSAPPGCPLIGLVYAGIHNGGDVIAVTTMERSRGLTLQQESGIILHLALFLFFFFSSKRRSSPPAAPQVSGADRMSLGANLVQASRLRAAYGSIFERWRDLERTSMSPSQAGQANSALLPHPARGWEQARGIVGDLTLACFHQHCPCICLGRSQRSLARASTHLQMRLGVQDAGSSPLSAWPFFPSGMALWWEHWVSGARRCGTSSR